MSEIFIPAASFQPQKNIDMILADAKRSGASRVFFCLGDVGRYPFERNELRTELLENFKKNVKYFSDNGIEAGIWIGTFGFGGATTHYNKKIAGVNNSQVATSSDNRRWEFEPTGTEDEFYVKNVGSGLYITTVPKNAAVTMTATSTSNAAKFKVVYNDDETLSFLYNNDETMALNLKSDNTIIAGNAGEQRSKWLVKVAVDNQTAIEDIEEAATPVMGIYDLTGRKLDEITKPGIYVIDGKKTLVK